MKFFMFDFNFDLKANSKMPNKMKTTKKRHWERSETIQETKPCSLDCFAALAMTPLILFFYSVTSFADSYLCIPSYQYIDTGNTTDQVTKACGKPSSVTTKQVPNIVNVPTEQWLYHGNSNPYEQPISGSYSLPYNLQHDLTRPPKLTITFKDNKVISVSLDGREVGATSLCSSPIVKGESSEDVQGSCGNPEYTNAGSQSNFEGMMQQSIWTYQQPAGQPPLILEFENGKLTRILSQ